MVGEIILGGKCKVGGLKAVGRVRTRIRVLNPSCENGSGKGEGEGWLEGGEGRGMGGVGGVGVGLIILSTKLFIDNKI